MKKIYALLAGALLTFTTTVEAQTSPRTVLFEEFTGENCGPCAGINPYMKRFSDLNAQDSFIHLAYQSPIPSAGPIYNIYKTDCDARMTYYSVNFAPWGENDGGLFPIWASGMGAQEDNLVTFYFDSTSIATQTPQNPTSPGFTARRAIASPCTITITHRYSTNYDSVYAMAIVTNTSTYTSTSSLKFRIALTEKQLTYSSPPGNNGEVEFYNVVRKMYPTAAGTTMAATQTTGTADTFYVAAKIPSYVRDRSQLQFIGWVQDEATKEVKQAGSSALQPVTNLTDILADGDSLPGITCNNSGSTPIYSFVNVKNTGGTTITTMSVKILVDGTLNSTMPWTGSLAPGVTAQLNVGPITISSGTHLINFIVSNPNGVPTFSSVYDTAQGVSYLSGTSVATPYQQAFEVTTSFPPANCYSQAGANYPFYPSSAFGTTGNTYWGAEGTTNSIVSLSFYNPDGDICNFYLPKMNFSTSSNAKFTFWHAYRQFNFDGTNLSHDSLLVQASTDCGGTWTTVWGKGGNSLATVAAPASAGTANTPSYQPGAASEWVQDIVTFGSQFNNHDDVWLRFQGISNYGDNVFVDQVNIEDASGINTLDNVSVISVFPNPANDNVSLELGVSQTSNFDVTIINTLGQAVQNVYNGEMSQGSHTLDVNVAGLSAGVYNMEIVSNNQKTVKRFVVSH